MTSKMPPVPKDQRAKGGSNPASSDTSKSNDRGADDPKGTGGNRENIKQNTSRQGNR